MTENQARALMGHTKQGDKWVMWGLKELEAMFGIKGKDAS